MKKLLTAALVSCAVIGGVPAAANAQAQTVTPYASGEWHGPHSNRATCEFINWTLPITANVGNCEKHDDGKWWFYES